MKIIAGYLGGRKLKTVPGEDTRPTAEKIRGAIFNTLGQYFAAEDRVLDLFGGTGALALEAISRGSERAVIVEKNRTACKIIAANIETLAVSDKVSLYCGDYKKYLTSTDEVFDLIFLDPPYKMKVMDDILQTLFTQQRVLSGGRIVMEVSNAVYMEADLAFLVDYNVVFDRSYDATRIIIIEKE